MPSSTHARDGDRPRSTAGVAHQQHRTGHPVPAQLLPDAGALAVGSASRASARYFEGTELAVVAHGHARIIDERDPAFAELDAVQVQCGNESPRDWQGRAVYLWLEADSLFTYASDAVR